MRRVEETADETDEEEVIIISSESDHDEPQLTQAFPETIEILTPSSAHSSDEEVTDDGAHNDGADEYEIISIPSSPSLIESDSDSTEPMCKRRKLE